MNSRLQVSVIAGVLALATIGEASAFERNGSVTGPRGTSSVHVQGGCSGSSCSRNVTRTGPYGGTVTRSGAVSCSPESSSCSGSRTTTGPYGGTVTRQGTISR